MSEKTIKWASIAKKVTLAIVGLFLSIFLLVHLGINLLMLLRDGGEAFGMAAGIMGSPIVKPFEVILFLAFIVHIITAIIVWWHNQRSRPVKYKSTNKSSTAFLSKYMIYTGVIILIFLVLHLIHFWWQKVAHHNHDFFPMAEEMFSNLPMVILYVVSFIVLAFHLNHSVQSGFQTLGWASDKYTPLVKKISTIYSIIIAVGFSIIPIIMYIRG